MKLINIDEADLHNETLASDNDYARVRVGLLRDLKHNSDSYKKIVEEHTALSNKYDSLSKRYTDMLEMEHIQRKRAYALNEQLEAYESIKLDIKG
jgi:hypothetical protein